LRSGPRRRGPSRSSAGTTCAGRRAMIRPRRAGA
jgi:hypothetical protein